jgi:hypothetical protein
MQFIHHLQAQPDTLFKLNDGDALMLKRWYDQALKNDSVAFLSSLQTLEVYYKKNGNDELRKRAWYFQIEYKAALQTHFDAANTIIKDGARQAHDRKWYAMEGECLVNLGLRLAEANKWGPAYEFMLKGHQLLVEYGYEHYPITRNYLYLQGLFYVKAGEYEKAYPLLRKFCSYWKDPAIETEGYYALNTLGLAYKNSGQFDSAIYFLKLAIENATYHQNPIYATLGKGNLGQAFFENKQYDEALPLLLDDYQQSLQHNMEGSAKNASITLSRLYLYQKDLATAEKFIRIGKGVLDHAELAPKVMYYKTQFDLHKYQADWKSAVIYADSAQLLEDSLRKLQDATILQQAQRRVEVERHSTALNRLDALRRQQVTLRNTILGVFSFIALILIQFYYRRMTRRKRALEMATLNEELARQALNDARRELEQYTRNLKEKNELIESIRVEMDQLRATGDQVLRDRSDKLNDLIQHAILTESDWIEFRTLFEKVHPGFFQHLKEKMPDLTPADIRLLAFTKLRLSTKEMAALLGISVDSIKKSRQRLRRRVHLPEEGSLDELIADL